MAARIILAWVGRTRDPELRTLVERYLERSARFVPTEARDLRASRAADVGRRIREDMVTLRQAAGGADAVLVTERGAQWTSKELASRMRDWLEQSSRPICFLAGGEAGFRAEDEAWAARRLGLSRLTLPHELARVVLAEQVYRALTLIRNLKYHK